MLYFVKFTYIPKLKQSIGHRSCTKHYEYNIFDIHQTIKIIKNNFNP